MCKAMEDMRNEAAREKTLQPGGGSFFGAYHAFCQGGGWD